MMRVSIAFFSALFLVACAGGNQVGAGVPFATVEFEKGYTTGANPVQDEATFQEYSISNDGQCASRRRVAAFTWVNGGVVRRRAAAGQPLHVSAVTDYYAAGTRLAASCSAWATFTPEAGRTYRVVQAEQSFGVCELRVVDQQLGQAPSDLTIKTAGCPLTSPCVTPDAGE